MNRADRSPCDFALDRYGSYKEHPHKREPKMETEKKEKRTSKQYHKPEVSIVSLEPQQTLVTTVCKGPLKSGIQGSGTPYIWYDCYVIYDRCRAIART
jgi:hypothetical protein